MKYNKSEKLYDKNSEKWKRDKFVCLSDFTARDKIFKIAGNLKNMVIGDLGCGEGFCSRFFEKKGARKIYGFDISQKMINLAKSKNTKKIVFKKSSITNIKLKKNTLDHTFVIFVFNYLKKKEIIRACKEIYRVTKNGGKIYISVPHPFYPFLAKKNEIFFFKTLKSSDYINKVDKELKGYISRIDKTKLPVKMYHHTLEDYFNAFRLSKLKKILDFKELKVTKKHLKKNFNFFGKVKNLPLHILFILEK